MKKTFILLALSLISLTAVCQKQKKAAAKAKQPATTVLTDSTGAIITDTTKIISIRDVQQFDILLSKIPHDQYINMTPNGAIKEFYLWIMSRYKKPEDKK